MDENWYTNESVWSLSFIYPDPQEDKKRKKKKATILRKQIARFVHVQVLPVHMKNTRKNNHYLGMEQPMYRITQNVHVPSILVQASLDYKGS